MLAFGVTAWELLTGEVPFKSISDSDTFDEVKKGNHLAHLKLEPICKVLPVFTNAALLIEKCLETGILISW